MKTLTFLCERLHKNHLEYDNIEQSVERNEFV